MNKTITIYGLSSTFSSYCRLTYVRQLSNGWHLVDDMLIFHASGPQRTGFYLYPMIITQDDKALSQLDVLFIYIYKLAFQRDDRQILITSNHQTPSHHPNHQQHHFDISTPILFYTGTILF